MSTCTRRGSGSPDTSAAYPAAFPVGVLPTNENDTGLILKTTSVDAFRADGAQLDPSAMGDPNAFSGNGYMLLGLETDGLATRYRDDSARRGGPMMVLAAPTLPAPGLSHACDVYGASVLVLPDASRDAVQVRAVTVHARRDQRGLAVCDGVDGRHPRRDCGPHMTEPPGPTEWGDSHGVGPWEGPSARRSALRPRTAA